MRPHRNLIVWQQSIELVKKIYILTGDFPETKKLGITSQIRRASVSIPANIAEGTARNTNKDYAKFLHLSSGPLSEVDTLLFISNELGFVTKEEFESMNTLNEKVGALLNELIKSVVAKIL